MSGTARIGNRIAKQSPLKKSETKPREAYPTAYASAPVSRLKPPTAEEAPVLFTEGDPVEYQPSNRSYAAKIRASEKQQIRSTEFTKEELQTRTPPLPQRNEDKKLDSASRLQSGGHWLLNTSDVSKTRTSEGKGVNSSVSRMSPYRKSQTEENLLNVVSEVKPKAVMSASPPQKSNSSSQFSSPEQRRTPIQDVERVIYLENKLKQSTDKCKRLEKMYKDLLTKQVKCEQVFEGEIRRKNESRDIEMRTFTPFAEETTTNADPTLESGGSVEALLRRVLEELQDLRVRMTRIEGSTARIGYTHFEA